MPSNIVLPHTGYRDYVLMVSKGELYEVWLHHDWEEPKPCVVVKQLVHDGREQMWEVLVDGTVQKVFDAQIFRIGTATRPESPYSFPGHSINLMPTTTTANLFYKFSNFTTKGEPT